MTSANHQQPQPVIVTDVELPGLLSTTHKRGQRISLELVSRCPVRWRVTWTPRPPFLARVRTLPECEREK